MQKPWSDHSILPGPWNRQSLSKAGLFSCFFKKSPLPLLTPLGLKRIWSPLLRLRALLSTSGGALLGPSHTSRGLPNFTGAPSHTSGALPNFTGAPSHTSGALPSASGAPSHTSGALPSASGGPSHTSGALPNLAGAPSHTSGALPNFTGAPSHTSGALPSASGGPSHTSGALPNFAAVPSHTSGALPSATRALCVVSRHRNTKFWTGAEWGPTSPTLGDTRGCFEVILELRANWESVGIPHALSTLSAPKFCVVNPPVTFGNAPEVWEGAPVKYGNTAEVWEGAPVKFGNAPEVWEGAPAKFGNAPEVWEGPPDALGNAPEGWEGAPVKSGNARRCERGHRMRSVMPRRRERWRCYIGNAKLYKQTANCMETIEVHSCKFWFSRAFGNAPDVCEGAGGFVKNRGKQIPEGPCWLSGPGEIERSDCGFVRRRSREQKHCIVLRYLCFRSSLNLISCNEDTIWLLLPPAWIKDQHLCSEVFQMFRLQSFCKHLNHIMYRQHSISKRRLGTYQNVFDWDLNPFH